MAAPASSPLDAARQGIDSLVLRKEFRAAVVQCEELELLASKLYLTAPRDSISAEQRGVSTHRSSCTPKLCVVLGTRLTNNRYMVFMVATLNSYQSAVNVRCPRCVLLDMAGLQAASTPFGAEDEHYAKVQLVLLLVLDDV